MQWNLMDVGITDVHDVIPVIENITDYEKDNATTICRNAKKKYYKNWDLYFMKCGIAITNYTIHQMI